MTWVLAAAAVLSAAACVWCAIVTHIARKQAEATTQAMSAQVAKMRAARVAQAQSMGWPIQRR